MKNLDSDNLQEVVQQHDKLFVQYGAEWCGACKIMKPQVTDIEGNYEGIEFIYVDAEKNPQSRQLATVDNLPTFAVFEKGEFKKQVQASLLPPVKRLLDEIASN